MSQEKVTIFDTTLRDGEQSAGIGLTTQEKLEIARQLERLGVDVIEAGFAAASPGDLQAVQKIASEVRTPKIASLARCYIDDVDKAWEGVKGAARPRLHVFISSSDIQRKSPAFGVRLVNTASGAGSIPSGPGLSNSSGLSNSLLCEPGMTINPPSPGLTSVK